jgi:hypothetical protein
MQPTLDTNCQSSSVSQAFLPTVGLVDGFNYQLTSPLQSPNSPFFFEIEPDKTTYETCYDEFMELKLAVIQEIFYRDKVCSFTSLQEIDVYLRPLCPDHVHYFHTGHRCRF